MLSRLLAATSYREDPHESVAVRKESPKRIAAYLLDVDMLRDDGGFRLLELAER